MAGKHGAKRNQRSSAQIDREYREWLNYETAASEEDWQHECERCMYEPEPCGDCAAS